VPYSSVRCTTARVNYDVCNIISVIRNLVMNLTTNVPEIMASYDPLYTDLKITEAANASSAAIPYFPAVRLSNGHQYVDGGFAANDPVLVAYTEARKIWGRNAPIRILSLGTGILPSDEDWKSDNVSRWGAIQWMNNGLLDLMIDAPNELMYSQVKSVLTLDSPHNRILRINSSIPNIKLDAVEEKYTNILKSTANKAFNERVPDLVDFFNPQCSRHWNV
jgi:predicted acylesterase/phospholipase RssA